MDIEAQAYRANGHSVCDHNSMPKFGRLVCLMGAANTRKPGERKTSPTISFRKRESTFNCGKKNRTPDSWMMNQNQKHHYKDLKKIFHMLGPSLSWDLN